MIDLNSTFITVLNVLFDSHRLILLQSIYAAEKNKNHSACVLPLSFFVTFFS